MEKDAVRFTRWNCAEYQMVLQCIYILKEEKTDGDTACSMGKRTGDVIEKSFRHQSLEERAEKYGGKLGPYEEFEWGSPVGREVW